MKHKITLSTNKKQDMDVSGCEYRWVRVCIYINKESTFASVQSHRHSMVEHRFSDNLNDIGTHLQRYFYIMQ